MIQDLIARAATEDWDAVDELEQMAKANPAALRPHLGELLERGLLWPPVMFAGADEETVRHVIDRIDGSDESLNHLLLIMSEVRSATVAAAFRRWQESPPPGMDRLHVDALAYARQGGWDLRADGTDHELYSRIAYELHRQLPGRTRCAHGASRRSGRRPIWIPRIPMSRGRSPTPAGPAGYASPPAFSAPTTRRCSPT